MEKIKKWYRKLNLQNKLRISYIALILIPVTVICVVYYEVASQSIIEIAKNNILEGMIKNVQILDRDLKGIQESAQGMNLNNEIYKLLEDLPKAVISKFCKRIRRPDWNFRRHFQMNTF